MRITHIIIRDFGLPSLQNCQILIGTLIVMRNPECTELLLSGAGKGRKHPSRLWGGGSVFHWNRGKGGGVSEEEVEGGNHRYREDVCKDEGGGANISFAEPKTLRFENTRKCCDFYSAAQKIASDFSAISSAIFWRFFCDFCGKACDLVLCGLKNAAIFLRLRFFGTLRTFLLQGRNSQSFDFFQQCCKLGALQKSEAQKKSTFLATFWEVFNFRKSACYLGNFTREPLNLIKSPIFTNTPCKFHLSLQCP